MPDLFDNPMGLMGFEFVEFASPTANVMEPLFEKLGFSLVARHRSKDVVLYRHGDGFKGWPGQAPFDGIIVAAAPGEVPPALLDQLSEGGRLVIPVGPAGEQDLVRVTRTADGLIREHLSRVSFVPLVQGTG